MSKLCYVDTGSFIIHIKAEDFYKDIADDVKERYDTSIYEVDRPLQRIKLKGIKVRVSFEENIEKKHLCRHDKNYCYY